MNFDLDVEQAMLKKSAGEFFAKELDSAIVRETEESEKGYDPELWKKMARLGWMGLLIPEAYGGEEMSLLDMVVVLEEMGKKAYTGPFFASSVATTMILMAAASEDQKKNILPDLCAGKKIATIAWREENTGHSAVCIKSTAVPYENHYLINGTKLFVPYGHIADEMVIAVRTRDAGEDENDGISLFIVDMKTDGIGVEVIDTTSGDKQCEIILDQVRVPAENLIGELHLGWKHLKTVFQLCAIAKCAEMIGGADQVLKMTVEYAKQREQFGQPIGSFQAVQHHCVNMLMLLELSKAATYRTAWMIREGKPCFKEMAMCKAWVSDAYGLLAKLGIQVMGGFGCMEEADHQFYFRRAKAAEISFGDATYQREQVALEMGL